MKLAINVGGEGKRIRHLFADIPKPMIPVNGKPVLERLVEWAGKNSFDELLFLCGFKNEMISSYFGNGSKWGIPIKYSIENRPLGSGGAIKHAAEHLLGNTFAYISGDLICNVNFLKMLDSHSKSGAIMTVLVQSSTHPKDSDILQLGEQSRVIRFIDKKTPKPQGEKLSNAGLCIMEPIIFEHMIEDVFTLETYLYPKLLSSGIPVNGYVSDELINDIGTPERLHEIETLLHAMEKNA
jgi:mannose-1-phosphate guanylyltransferase/phosphomannomutase